MEVKNFIKQLKTASTEEEVIAAYQRLIPVTWKRPFRSDGILNVGRISPALFEFKFDKKMDTNEVYPVIAQGCYYLNKIYSEIEYKNKKYEIPKNLVVADVNEAIVIPSSRLEKFWKKKSIDWRRAPSNPDKKLVRYLEKKLPMKNRKIYQVQLEEDVNLFINRLGVKKYLKKPEEESSIVDTVGTIGLVATGALITYSLVNSLLR